VYVFTNFHKCRLEIHFIPLGKENICYFISAAEEFGVARHRLFAVSDLYDNLNFYKVLECLEDLALVAKQQGNMIFAMTKDVEHIFL
jgi:hypothetical protein